MTCPDQNLLGLSTSKNEVNKLNNFHKVSGIKETRDSYRYKIVMIIMIVVVAKIVKIFIVDQGEKLAKG